MMAAISGLESLVAQLRSEVTEGAGP